MTKVSVIIPAYNIEKHIGSCLDSIINQTLKEIQIIVINDGSTDNTSDIIQKYILKDQRIELINTKNKGVSAARNKGIIAAEGKYVYQIDGDDWLEKNGLKKLYEYAEKESADIVISNMFRGYKDGTIKTIDGHGLTDDYVKDFLTRKIIPSVCTKFYRRSLFIDNGIFYTNGIRVGEDLLINLKLFYHAKKVKKITETFLHYVYRSDSTMNTSKSEANKDIIIVFDEIKSFLTNNNVYTKYKSEFMYLKYYHAYYVPVLQSNKFGPIHKFFYDTHINEKNKYINNKYIKQFLTERTIRAKIRDFFYNKNYYIGILVMKTIYRVRKIRYLIKSNF